MIADPYKILGVSENCTDDELKKAYREKSKKWHPDANIDAPELAEQKFKEVQEAYRQIVDARERGTGAYGGAYGTGGNYRQGSTGQSYGGSYGYRDFGGFGGFEDFFNQWANYSGARRAEEERIELTAARNYINNGHYREALTSLGQVPELERTARWYYFAAVASQRIGNNIDAMNHAKRAADMEPDNQEYRTLLQQLQNGGSWYQSRGETYQTSSGMPPAAGWCLSMVALNLCCNCFGGRVWWC